jgi:riboflavin synthase
MGGYGMRIAIVDTMFSRVDMGAIAVDEIKKHPDVEIERRTVPGIKDLPVECKRLLDSGADIAMALGMVGGAPIDTQCGHEASLGIQQAKLMTNKHIIEVFVHENEGWNQNELRGIFENRIRKHAQNAILLVKDPSALVKKAGMGVRQGKEDEGPISGKKNPKLGIVVSRFNAELTGRMEKSAIKAAGKAKAETVIIKVPGAFDMPLIVKKMLMDKSIDAVVTLGAVVKGETSHDEVVTKNVARKLTDLSLEFRKPVTLGIIGHNASEEAADARAEEYGKRAVEAALAMLEALK